MNFIGCRLCCKTIHELMGAYLIRINEKGMPGVWECRPMCGSDLPQDTLLLMAIEGDAQIEQKEEGK